MDRVQLYRRQAAECRELARRMPPPYAAQLLEMAQVWDKLAQDRAPGALATEGEGEG